MVTRSKSDRLCRIDRTNHTCAHVVTVVDTVLCQFHFEFKFPIYIIFKVLETIYPNLQPFTGKVQACSECIALFCNLTHCGPVTQICVFTLQLCKMDDANLRFYHALGFHALYT